MEQYLQQIFNLIKDISVPAAIVFIVIILNRAGVLSLLVDFFRSKINGSTDPTIHEKLTEIQTNDFHGISEMLDKGFDRLERKLDKLDAIENLLIKIDTKINGRK